MLEFDEVKHEYRLDGQLLPSVTQIIRFLNYDTAENAKAWLRDAAGIRGSKIHAYCEDIDYGALPDRIDWDCIGYVDAYKAFLRDYRPEWLYVEQKLGSLALGYAGTIDRIGLIDGVVTIVDLKTGSKVNKATLTAQLIGYQELCLDNGLIHRLPNLLGLQLKKDGTYKLIPCERDYDLWKACKILHKGLVKTT